MESKPFEGYEGIFASNFRKLIEEKNLTQIAVAEAVGVSRQAISQYCNGQTIPTADKLRQIAECLNVSTDYLLGLSPTPSKNEDESFVVKYTGLDKDIICFLHENFAIRGLTYREFKRKWDDLEIHTHPFAGSMLDDILSDGAGNNIDIWDIGSFEEREDCTKETFQLYKRYIEEINEVLHSFLLDYDFLPNMYHYISLVSRKDYESIKTFNEASSCLRNIHQAEAYRFQALNALITALYNHDSHHIGGSCLKRYKEGLSLRFLELANKGEPHGNDTETK